MSTVTERVAAGAAFLDEKVPYWWTRVNLDALRMDAGCACVLGQVFREEAKAGLSRTGFTYALENWIWEPWHAVDLGFEANAIDDPDEAGASTRCDADYTQLGAEWTRLIISLRQGSLLHDAWADQDLTVEPPL